MAALTEEQTLIRDQAKAWASEQAPVSSFRAMRDSGIAQRYQDTTWEQMIEMGWTGILVPETYGGSDLGYLTFGVVLEELGRQLTAAPLFASACAGTSALLLGGSDDQKQALLPKVVDGSEILTLAIDDGAHHKPEALATALTADGGGLLLNGSKSLVPEGMAATTFIVAAQGPDGPALALVPAGSAGVSREAVSALDSRGYAQVSFKDVALPAGAVLSGGTDLLDTVLDRARAALSAEMLGTASQAFDMTLDYLKTREQFGRVIGSFQTLGHRAAELYGSMELSRSCSEAALAAIDAGDENLAELCSLAKARVGQFLFDMSNQLIQIHGGIGMTDEFDAGLYLKRARTLEAAYGNRAYHRDRYARVLGF